MRGLFGIGGTRVHPVPFSLDPVNVRRIEKKTGFFFGSEERDGEVVSLVRYPGGICFPSARSSRLSLRSSPIASSLQMNPPLVWIPPLGAFFFFRLWPLLDLGERARLSQRGSG